MIKKLLLLIVLALGAAAYFGVKVGNKTVTVDLSAEQVRQQVATRFPAEKSAMLASLKFSDPTVEIKDGSERVLIHVKATVSIPLKSADAGTATFSGKVKFDDVGSQFLLVDSRLDEVAMAKIPERFRDEISALARLVAGDKLENLTLYKLSSDNNLEAAAKHLFKSAEVTEGKIRITLGLNNKWKESLPFK